MKNLLIIICSTVLMSSSQDDDRYQEFDLSPVAMDSICQVMKYNGLADDADYLYFDLDMWEKAILTNYMKLDHTNEENLKPLIAYMTKNFQRFKCAGVDLFKRETGILELLLLCRDYDQFHRFLKRYKPDPTQVCDPFGRNMIQMIDVLLVKGNDGYGRFFEDQRERILEIRQYIVKLSKEGYLAD
jgi:hypothetical protein